MKGEKPVKTLAATPSEDRIRDYLASHIGILESGLTVVEREYSLPYEGGAGGRLDILARDQFGLLVVIEIKRSDKAAREALQELFKYVALIRINMGIEREAMRCILISTHWHELLLPFSEFSQYFPYHVDAFRIDVNERAEVISLEEIRPLGEADIREICPVQVIYFCAGGLQRASLGPLISDTLRSSGVEDFCVLLLDYEGSHPAVELSWAAYVVLDGIEGARRGIVENAIYDAADSLYSPIPDRGNADTAPDWWLESAVLEILNSRASRLASSTEIGYPSKLGTMLEEWRLSRVIRSGRFERAAPSLTDSVLPATIAGFKGENPFVYKAYMTPRLERPWRRVLDRTEGAFRDAREWERGLQWFARVVADEIPSAAVSLSIFNPPNIMLQLYHLATAGDISLLPLMEIIADPPQSEVIMLHGLVTWDGKTRPQNPGEIAHRMYPEDSDGLGLLFNACSPEENRHLMTEHGLEYALVRTRVRDGEYEPSRIIGWEGVQPVFNSGRHDSLNTLSSFLKENRVYLRELIRWAQLFILP